MSSVRYSLYYFMLKDIIILSPSVGGTSCLVYGENKINESLLG